LVNQDKVSQLRYLLRDVVKVIFNSVGSNDVDEIDREIVVRDVAMSPVENQVWCVRLQPEKGEKRARAEQKQESLRTIQVKGVGRIEP